MIKSDYWFIKPHTERKLDILEKYLNAWCDILFSRYQKNPTWRHWKTPFFIDCFSGRGMYHKDGKLDCVDGSPVLAIKLLIEKKNQFKKKHSLDIFPKVRLIEYDAQSAQELRKFIQPYTGEIDVKVYENDFNQIIGDIITETKSSPAFFFVDAGGIKELKKESVEKIVSKKGARDILLNYVVDGPSRIGGLGKSLIDGTYKGKRHEGAFKTINVLEDFTGMPIVKYLQETGNDNKDALVSYVQNVLHANNQLSNQDDRLQTIAYDMKDLKRKKLVYYLLFSSRREVAMNIMKSIFRETKKNESNQQSLFEPSVFEIKP